MIPEGWREATAEELCSRISVGIVIKPTQYYVDKEQGVRAFRSANIGEGFVRDSDWIHISEDGHTKNKKSALKANDILIVRTGYPGTACLLPPEFEGSNCIDIIFARPDPEQVVPAYLCTYTNSEYGKKQVLDGSGGLAQQHFNVGAYKKLKLPLPPLSEQKRIAETLQTWDRAIETVEALIANVRAQKQALMQQLLPQGTTPPKKRLPGFSGEWREGRLGSLADISKGEQKGRASLSGEGPVPVINGGITPSGYTDDPNTAANTITISEGGNSCGHVDLITQPFWCGGHCYALKNLKVDRGYLFAVLKHRQPEIMSLRVGSGLPNIQKKALSQFSIPVPARPEQEKIGKLAASVDKEIAALEAQLTALRQEKAALMQQLLTGKRRVKLPESEVA